MFDTRAGPPRRNPLSLSRTSIAVFCIAGLIALPAAAGAQKKPKTATSHVIKTPRGNQLAVPITVRYRLEGKSLDDSRLTTRVNVAARLPGGRVLRAAETRTLPGKVRGKVEQHPFFSVSRTRELRRALAGPQARQAGGGLLAASRPGRRRRHRRAVVREHHPDPGLAERGEGAGADQAPGGRQPVRRAGSAGGHVHERDRQDVQRTPFLGQRNGEHHAARVRTRTRPGR